MVYNKINQILTTESRQKYQNYLKGLIAKKGNDDDLVDNDIDSGNR